jgi:hypothetical protein
VLHRLLRTVIWEPVSPAPLSALRIAIALLLLCEFAHLVHRRDLVFVSHPLEEELSWETWIALGIWGGALLCLLVGFLTPLAAAVNYVVATKYLLQGWVYHADYLYIPTALYLVVLPVARRFSVDALLLQRWWGIDVSTRPVPRLFQNAILFQVAGLMYIDSTLYKLASPFWIHGLGFWLPASFPSFTTFDWNFVLNQRELVLFAGYLALFFEFIWIFIFWIPRVRIYLFLIGVVLHLGIAIVLPLPFFGLLMVALFINFFPDRRLEKLFHIRFRTYPPETGFARLDRARCLGAAVLVSVSTILQASLLFEVPLLSKEGYALARRYLGLNRHAVFGQWQFTAMTRDVAVVYYDADGQEHWIPWTTKEGHTGSEGYSRFWSGWWIAALPDRPGQEQLWARACEAWAKRTGKPLSDGYVLVKERSVISGHYWERDRYANMKALPWRDLMRITWRDGRRHFESLRSAPPK